MSSARITGLFILDSGIAALLWLSAIAVSGIITDALPDAYRWLYLAIFYLAVSPVAFYARWRGHVSFATSDVAVFLPAPLLFGAIGDFLLDDNFVLLFPFAVTCVLAVLFRFRRWLHGLSDEAQRDSIDDLMPNTVDAGKK